MPPKWEVCRLDLSLVVIRSIWAQVAGLHSEYEKFIVPGIGNFLHVIKFLFLRLKIHVS